MINKKYNIQYGRAITLWDEALPLGNGKMGCLLYGDGPIRLSLDRVDLWDTRVHPTTREEGFSYQNLVRLSTSGRKEDWEERDRLFERIYDEYAFPSKITAGRMELHMKRPILRMKAFVDIQTAVGRLAFDEGEVEVFLHATRFIGIARVRGEFDLRLHIPDYISGQNKTDRSLVGNGGTMNPGKGMEYPIAKKVTEDGFSYYVQDTLTDLRYGVFVYEKKTASETELYFTVATNRDGEDFVQDAKEELLLASKEGYAKLFKEHTAWWKKYWKKSSISLGDELLERTYYRSMYLFASCSRKGCHPMPLQGVWTADNDALPPWKGDYHHDTNTQLSYQSYLKANRLEEGECFIDYLWHLKPQFETVAKDFYGVDGIMIPGVSTIDGKPMGGWAQYALSPTMSIWTAQSFDEYYLYTGDRGFLENRAFPFMEGVGKAVSSLLVEKDGKLYLPLSTSPEIHDADPQAYLKPNTNFDLALMRYLFTRLAQYCTILEKDPSKYHKILEKLDDIALIDGYIGLDREERLGESHRHFSHLMCLYPLHLINYDTREHREIYHRAIEEIERLGTGMWVGFSYAMCAQIYAMARMGNAAYEKLRQFADGFVAANGFHLNGDFQNKGYSTFHYRPFTLESLYGYCDALQEMLLQEHQGYLHLFPAIPKAWEEREISCENLRSYDGLLVSAKAKNGFLQELILHAPRQMDVCVKNTFASESVVAETKKQTETIHAKDGYLRLHVKKGRTRIRVKGEG